MKCSKLRRLLADGGPAALAGNQEAEDHLVDCGECFAVLEALSEIDDLLPGLPGYDVADEVVDQLLASSELSETSEHCPTAPADWMAGVREHLPTIVTLWARLEPAKRLGEAFDRARRARLRWGIVALPAVLLIGIVSVQTMRSLKRPNEAGLASKKIYTVKQVKFKQRPADPDGLRGREDAVAREGGASVDGIEAGRDEAPGARMSGKIEGLRRSEPAAIPAPIPEPVADQPEPGLVPDDNLVLGVPDAPPPSDPGPVLMVVGADDRDQGRVADEVTGEQIEQAMESSFEGDVMVTGSLIPRADLTALQPVVVGSGHGGRVAYSEALKDAQEGRPSQIVDKETADQIDEQLEVLKKHYEKAAGEPYVGGKNDDAKKPSSRSQSTLEEAPEIDDGSLSAARQFLMDRDWIDGLTFREARGYWANTYVPGDRTLRRLKARLDRIDGAGAAGSGCTTPRTRSLSPLTSLKARLWRSIFTAIVLAWRPASGCSSRSVSRPLRGDRASGPR